MRFTPKPKPKQAPLDEWRMVFAWRPVKANGTWVWLERVWRRRPWVRVNTFNYILGGYEYALALSV